MRTILARILTRTALVAFAAAPCFAPGLARAASDGPVVRPQIYTANDKLEIAAVVGYVSNDPFNRIIVPGVSVAYHYGEHSAIEVHAGYGMYSPKQLLSQVRQKTARDPAVVSRPQFFVTGNYMWTPIYGKLAAFGEVVLHYDLFVLAGGGIVNDEIETNTTTQNGVVVKTISNKIFPATNAAIGQHIFFSKRTALRVEIRPYVFWEQIDNKWDPNGDVQVLTGFSFLF